MAVVASALSFLPAACGEETPSPSLSPTTNLAGKASGAITVFAAASLTEAFTRIGKDFEAANPEATVMFNFAASSALAAQIAQGAPADVFASADDATLNRLIDAGGTSGAPVTFARNTLAVIVGRGNPAHIASINDLTDPELIVVLCGPQVPIGAYSVQVFEKAGITVTPRSLEADVKSVVTKVAAGEADAGIVYATDVRAAGEQAQGVAIPAALNVEASYPMTVTRDAPNAAAANLFVRYVMSDAGRATLVSFGFAGP